MPSSPKKTTSAVACESLSTRAIVFAGLVSLAVAMGIGRFAFTPILPMMLKDGVVDLASASWLASANYLGYMLGAIFCTFQPWIWARLSWLPALGYSSLVRAGLLATAALTLAMAWQMPAAWPVLRFAAGVTSALVFVYTSGWCLARLSGLEVPAMGGLIYAGPGAGIVVSGLLASGMVALHLPAATGWLIVGLLAFGLSALVWRDLHGGEHLKALATPDSQAFSSRTIAAAHHGHAEMTMLTLAYSLAGFGYIITATFLPVIARSALPGSAWLDLFWPIFGLGIMGGALLAARLPASGDLRVRLGVCYVVQALGIAASLWSPTLLGFVIGSLLLGIPFTAITFFALQEVRRLRPANASSFIGLLTAAYGLGQIAGPPLVALLIQHAATPGAAFNVSLQIATGALLVGAVMYAWMVRAYPVLK